jgi:hypothetical protein
MIATNAESLRDRIAAGAVAVLLTYTTDNPRIMEQTPFQNKNKLKCWKPVRIRHILGLLQIDNKAMTPQ